MLNHVSVGVSRLDRSTAFYDVVLAPLGYSRLEALDFGTAYGVDYPSFWMTLPESPDCAPMQQLIMPPLCVIRMATRSRPFI